jgi:hypothetical protein
MPMKMCSFIQRFFHLTLSALRLPQLFATFQTRLAPFGHEVCGRWQRPRLQVSLCILGAATGFPSAAIVPPSFFLFVTHKFLSCVQHTASSVQSDAPVEKKVLFCAPCICSAGLIYLLAEHSSLSLWKQRSWHCNQALLLFFSNCMYHGVNSSGHWLSGNLSSSISSKYVNEVKEWNTVADDLVTFPPTLSTIHSLLWISVLLSWQLFAAWTQCGSDD